MDLPNMDGAFDTHWAAPTQPSQDDLSTIQNALNATLDPRVPNEVRQQALTHLESIKSQPTAPHIGFSLADDWSQNDAVRYYGLQLLEYGVRYRWSDYSAEQCEQVKTWVKALAGGLRESEVAWIRNKIALLWVEVAKRCWGSERDEDDGWVDMDQLLLTLWDKELRDKGMCMKLFVLHVLESLSEDVVNGEDAVAGLRMDVLGNALNGIMVPRGLYQEFEAGRSVEDARGQARAGEEGWLERMCKFLASCVEHMRSNPGETELVKGMSICAVKTLHALRSTIAWINLKAAVEVNCIECLFYPFHTDDVAMQTAAIEVLYALLSRPYGTQSHHTWLTLIHQALRQDRIAMLRHTFTQSHTLPGEDDERYTLQKKTSELLSVLADSLASHGDTIDSKADMPAFFDLLMQVLQSKSLVVSIPVLHSWTKLMAVSETTISELVLQALGTLIQTCSERLLRYESIPEDDENEDNIIRFLYEDFESMPERHAFLGNYRRYCVSVIQTISRTRPLEALEHVLGQMTSMLESGPYTGGRGFDSSRYSKSSLSVLQFDAQYQVVAAALKGFAYWHSDNGVIQAESKDNHEAHLRANADNDKATQMMQQWCYNVINMHVDDPEVAAQVLQTLVAILRNALSQPEPGFVLHIVQHLLTMRLYDNSNHSTFSEAVKGFEALRVIELQKLALLYADELLEVYHELEPRIGVLVQKHNDDARLVWGYKAFLFMIIHRATGISDDVRLSRLQQMIKPVADAWQDPALSANIANLQAFCECLALGDLASFYKSYRFAEVSDWGTQQLDEAGQERQAQIKRGNEALPLRMTKSMLAATTEKLKAGSDAFDVACALWQGVIPVVLPNLLQMLRHAQAFHSMAHWSQLPDELQMVVKRTLQDRFWQSGISNESKDEFYARISGSKSSYEGFASVVRGTMRNVREQGYHILYLMTKFEEQFYGLPDLAQPLAEALFEDADSLGANHLHPVINLATGLVQRCPPHYRADFLPPLLRLLFRKLDGKISAEWEAIGLAKEQSGKGEDDLGDEMRVESVLRQLTYSMVSFVPFLLEYDKAGGSHAPQQPNGHASTSATKPTLSDLVLSDPTLLEPLILFCTHALRMRDTRCCVTICRVFRTLVPLFQSEDAPAPQVREFICTEVLKACITSLNEPYFADLQKDLAALIAQIINLYGTKTATPRDVLLSLPDMSASRVDKAMTKIGKAANERQQRALVLELLEGVRGVSIYEQGRIASMPKKGGTAGKKDGMGKYMEVEQRRVVQNGDESGLDGVAGLFEDA